MQILNGKTHSVFSGLGIYYQNTTYFSFEETKVEFKSLKKTEIENYIINSKPFDKAGAYGIQDWIGIVGIEKIEGDYYNVMGLPTAKLYDYL